MADPQEETGGHVADAPQEQGASTIPKDVKENGELPGYEMLAEIGGKGKQDPTLSDSTAPEVADSSAKEESSESAIPSEEAKDANGPSPSPQESSAVPREEAKEAGSEDDPTEEGIEEGFLSLVGLGPKSKETEEEEGQPPKEEAPNTEEPEKSEGQPFEGEAPKFEETEKNEGQSPEGDVPKSEETEKNEGQPREGETLKSEETQKIEGKAAEGEAPTTEDAENEEGQPAEGEALTSEETEEEGQPAEGEAPTFEETKKEFPAEKISPAGEPEVVQHAETEQAKEATTKATSEENPEAVGQAEEIPKSADTPETNEALGVEENTKAAETTETGELKTEGAARGDPAPVDTTQIGEPETQGAEADAHKSTESGKPEPVLAGEEEITPRTEEKPDEPDGAELAEEQTTKADEPSVAKGAEEEVPKTLESTEHDEPGEAKVAGEEVPKTPDTTEIDAVEPQIAADESPKPGEVGELKAAEPVVEEEQDGAVDNTDTADEAVAGVVSKGKDFSGDGEESTPTVGEEENEHKTVEGTPKEVQAPTPSPVEKEQPADEAEEDSNNVDESPEEAHEGEPAAHLPADIAEQDTSGHSPPGDASLDKEAGQTELGEAPEEGETLSKEVNPEVLTGVSGGPESSGNATTKSLKPVEHGNVDDSSKQIGVPSSEVEEKEIPPPETSKEMSTSAPEETVHEKEEGTVGSVEEPKEIFNTSTEEEKPADEGEESRALPEDASPEPNSTGGAEQAQQDTKIPQLDAPETVPITAAEDTIDRLNGEIYTEAKPAEGTSVPEKDDAVEEKPAEEQGPALEKQPSLSLYIPKQEEATVAEGETLEDNGLTTPHGTPLMQRVEKLEQKHPPSPSNGEASPQVPTVDGDFGKEPNSKPAESQTREWSPSGAEGDKVPGQVNSNEGSKAAGDPVKPNTETTSLPPETKPVAPSRSNSLQERKIKAKAAVGKLTGIFGGCFAPKKGGTTA